MDLFQLPVVFELSLAFSTKNNNTMVVNTNPTIGNGTDMLNNHEFVAIAKSQTVISPTRFY